MDALRTLEDCGWIEGDTIMPEHGGRWTVNPRAHELFTKEAERALQRRRAALYAMHGIDIVEAAE